MSDKSCRRKRCTNCGEILDAIWFTALMTEEWRWNGEGYNDAVQGIALSLTRSNQSFAHTVRMSWGQGWISAFRKDT